MIPIEEIKNIENRLKSMDDVFMPYALTDRIIAEVTAKGKDARNDVLTMLVEFVTHVLKIRGENNSQNMSALHEVRDGDYKNGV